MNADSRSTISKHDRDESTEILKGVSRRPSVASDFSIGVDAWTIRQDISTIMLDSSSGTISQPTLPDSPEVLKYQVGDLITVQSKLSSERFCGFVESMNSAYLALRTLYGTRFALPFHSIHSGKLLVDYEKETTEAIRILEDLQDYL